jgi:hypothetical protein
MEFTTKDSWERQQFEWWSQRDTNEWKPRYDLISVKALTRIWHLMARWAKKYNERNWEKWQPTNRFLESAMRHLFQYADWDISEDHLSAVCFNVMAIMHFQENNKNWEYDNLLLNKADEPYRQSI